MEPSSNEALWQSIIDSSLDIIQVFDAVRDKNGAITDFTWKIQNSKGFQQNGDLIGKRLLQLNPAVIPSGIFARMVQVADTGVPNEQEQYYSYEQFEEQWFYQALVKQNDGVLMTTRDITAQKKAKQEILRLKDEIASNATNKYYSIFNSIQEGFCIYELVYDGSGTPTDLRWIEVNPAYEKHTGLKDVVGKLHSDFSMETESYWLEVYDRVAKTGEAVHFEDWHEATGRWYSSFSSRIGGEGSKQVAVVFSDITERKQRERQQEYLLKLSDALRPLSHAREIEITACRILGEWLGVNRVYFNEIPGKEGIIRIESQYRGAGAISIAGEYPLEKYSWWAGTLRRGEPVIIPDLYQAGFVPPDFITAMEGIQACSLVTVPLIKDEEWIGALSMTDIIPRAWKEEEVELAGETMKRMCASAERARVGEALRKSEEKYRTLFNSIDEGFSLIELIFDENGKVIDYWHREDNPVFTKMTGIKDPVGKRMSELLPYVEPAWHQMLETIYYTGESIRVEYPVQELGQWFSAYMSRIGGDGSPVIACIYDDITERKRREQQQEYLLKLGDALRPLSDATEIEAAACRLLGEELKAGRAFYAGISEADNYVKVNQNYLSGDSPSLAGIHPLSAFSWILPLYKKGEPVVIDDVYKVDFIPPEYLPALEVSQVISFILIPLIKDNVLVSALIVSESAPRHWKEYEVTLLAETAARIWASTERAKSEEIVRRSEEKYRTLFESMDEGFVLAEVIYNHLGLPVDILYLEGNPAATRLTGVPDYTLQLWSKVAPGAENYWLEIYDRVVKTGISERLERFMALHGHWYDFYISPKANPDGAPQVTILFQDITERKRAEEALRESEQQLKRLLKLRDEFIGIASHELKTPVTSMKVYAEIVAERLEEIGNQDASNLLFRLNAQIDRLIMLINNLLDTTKISEGQLRLDLEEIDLNELLRDRVEEIKRTTNHVFELHTENLPCVIADRERIGQVITNLLSNAIKYSPKGTTIRIGSRKEEEGVRVSVQDEGLGIPEGDIDKIFERFFRVTAKNMDTYPGMGLGLYISRKIVEKHKGRIFVQSKEGEGTVFSFMLPC
ncbi:ATP-binding protein [Chitinophaga silvisoli]|uniref:histidine kinase n=1 Tax=Chitinophaga silvisoli TaxID=2291814 RepID=A0A3E1NVB1_9BACT|nr:ATP-binding protein [Chitinophaga silvisoli]RFM31846.1 PAS domain-containing protein [Chitinophaga silvisoli]